MKFLFNNIIYFKKYLIVLSGVYEEVATKGKQALLRYRANKIADYEALYQIHFLPQEPEPKYVYYVGEWHKSISKYDEAIYKGFEESFTFTKYTLEESDYDDKFSIWKYETAAKVKKERF